MPARRSVVFFLMPSLRSRLVELFLPLTGIKHAFGSEAAMRRAIARNRLAGPALPSQGMRRRLLIEETRFRGSRVFTVRLRSGEAKTHVLYLHGGAFVFDIFWRHWLLIERLVARTRCSVSVPLYPLAPEHTCQDVFDLLRPLYAELLAVHGAGSIFFMGDSAGASMSLALAQQARQSQTALPAGLALISPALDMTLSDERQPELARRDPMLDIPGSRAAGRWYAGAREPADPLISPLFGSLAGLPPIAVWTGTHDLLNPDARRLQAKAAAEGALVVLHEYEAMVHVWPLLRIPEAEQAVGEMADFLQNPTRVRAS
jgi:acetyl esterase/lipase